MAEPFTFTPDTKIAQALELGKRVEEAFSRLGLKCVDKRGEWCAASEVETLRDASRFHEVPLDDILSALNELRIVPEKKDEPSG